jgi:hypothetical protein
MFNSRFTNTKFRKNNNKNNLQKMRMYKPVRLLGGYHNALKRYIKGLLHPELAVTGNFVPKAPNYVSIPTSNITFREAFDIEPDSNGEFILYWTPNFLCTHETIVKRAEFLAEAQIPDVRYSRNWLGGFDDIYQTFCYTPMPAYEPPASFTKYRLVSAGCKITYKGPTINRSGIISHCLSYRGFPVVYFLKETKNIISADALSKNVYMGKSINEIDVTSIQNGMWNSVQNVQKNQTTFSVAIPTDPSDFIFEDDAYFYSSATAADKVGKATISWTDGLQQAQESIYWPQLPEDGTPCSYIFKGTDLTQNAKLYVEQFYNFEVIPTEESAPVLRPRVNDFNSSDLELSRSIASKTLENLRGQINESDYALDQLLNNTINSLNSNFTEIPQRDNVYIRKVVPQKPKSQSFAKRAWSTVKDNIKSGAKKVFTKKNAEFAANMFGQFMAGYTGAK